MSKRSDQIAKLLQAALDQETELELSILIRKAIRIARLRGDYRSWGWLEMEMEYFGAELSKSDLARELRTHYTNASTLKHDWDQNSLRMVEERIVPEYDSKLVLTGKNQAIAMSVTQLEEIVTSMRSEMQQLQDPRGNPRSHAMIRVNLGFSLKQRLDVLGRIRNRVVRHLNQVEAAVAFQDVSGQIFENSRRIVEAELSIIAPDVLQKFVAAEERITAGHTEAYSHALDSCRRALKAIADKLSASTEEVTDPQGVVHKLGDDNYINRLWQYLLTAGGKHASTTITVAILRQLGDRIESVNKMTNKGVHSDVVEHEAQQCVIQTFLVLADVLAIQRQSSTI